MERGLSGNQFEQLCSIYDHAIDGRFTEALFD
jgi:hypothetical protein